MTVLLVCDVYGRENNGTVIAEKNLLRALRAQGHTVRVLCADQGSRGEPGTFVCPDWNLGPWLNAYIAKNGVSLARPVKRIVAQAMAGVDLVHVFMPFTFGLGACAAKMATEKGICLTAGFHTQAENISNHFGFMDWPAGNRWLYRRFWKDLYGQCAAIHYPTAFVRRVFETAIGRSTNGFVISNGVQPVFRPGPPVPRAPELQGKYVVLFSGRFSKEKNQKMLVRAVALARNRDRIQLVFAGQGPSLKMLEREAASLPNKPIFRFFDRAGLVRLLRETDLYVHPALIDLESISCLEAIAAGVLPLLSDSPRAAVSEYSRDPHCVFRYDSPADLAAKMDWFIDHPQEAAAIRAKYQDFGQAYDFNTCMAKMEQMFVVTLSQFRKNQTQPAALREEH